MMIQSSAALLLCACVPRPSSSSAFIQAVLPSKRLATVAPISTSFMRRGEDHRSEKRLTLVFVRRKLNDGRGQILLGMKKRGFGQGKMNGFGGKVEVGETVKAAAIRELREEACLVAQDVKLRGKITFTFLTMPEILRVHVFEAIGTKGEPQETEEMAPEWVLETEIPFDRMWADDKYWLPIFLRGRRFHALFEFDDESTILKHHIRELTDTENLDVDQM